MLGCTSTSGSSDSAVDVPCVVDLTSAVGFTALFAGLPVSITLGKGSRCGNGAPLYGVTVTH